MRNYSNLEEITNEVLSSVRELEYRIQVFGDKSNSSNALKVRNLLKSFSSTSNKFKKISIDSFKN